MGASHVSTDGCISGVGCHLAMLDSKFKIKLISSDRRVPELLAEGLYLSYHIFQDIIIFFISIGFEPIRNWSGSFVQVVKRITFIFIRGIVMGILLYIS